MASFNEVILMGNLGGNPEQRFTAAGKGVVNFTMATSSGKKGEEKTQWHRVVAWEKLGDTVMQYLKKGSGALVVGRLEYRNYDDKDGVKRTSTDIIATDVKFLPSGKGAEVAAPDEDLPF